MPLENGNRSDGNGFLSGPRLLMKELRERKLDLLGGQDLEGSGFEHDEPDPDYSEEV